MVLNDHDYGGDIGPEERRILRKINEKENKPKLGIWGRLVAGSSKNQDFTKNKGQGITKVPEDIPERK